jgi:hypothetical protein
MSILQAALTAALFLALRVNATTIVGVWTEQGVVVVADSRITITDGKGKYVKSETGCKVHVVKDVLVATAGLLKNEVVDVIAAIERSKSFRDQATGKPLPEVGPIIAAQLAVEAVLKARGPDTFDPSVAVSLLIVALEDGGPALTRAEWIPLRADQLPQVGAGWNRYGFRRFKYPENRADAESRDRGVEIIGVRRAIDRYKGTAAATDWNDRDGVRFARRLVTLEVTDPNDSAVVGEPLTVVTLDKQGIQWRETGACAQ